MAVDEGDFFEDWHIGWNGKYGQRAHGAVGTEARYSSRF